MPTVDADGVRLAYERSGAGPAVVLVHGSFDDRHCWRHTAAHLRSSAEIVAYDRRGHGESDTVAGQGRIGEDVDDLAAVVTALGIAPAHLVGHSYGATVALLLAVRHPELCRTLTVHEPPLFGLLAGTPDAAVVEHLQATMTRAAQLIESGDAEAGTRLFVDGVGFGAGAWERVLTPEIRRTFVAHADTWLDQARDPDRLAVDADLLARVRAPVALTHGSGGPAWSGPLVRRLLAMLPDARLTVLPDAGHAPHLTHPEALANAVLAQL